MTQPPCETQHTYILKAEGFETLEADSGFAALEVLNSHPCSLAIIDVNMPRMDRFANADSQDSLQPGYTGYADHHCVDPTRGD